MIPEGVTKIGYSAFRDCGNLTSITLPSTLETLGENVFDGCNNLNIVDKSGKFFKNVDGIIYSADGTQIISVPSVSGEVRIAEGVTEIPDGLFGFDDRITSVVIPEGVTKIGYGAFRGCGNLTSVILPSTLETLGDAVFEGCSKLTAIEDKSGNIKIMEGIVYSADGTRIICVTSASGEIHIADGVTEIPDTLFNANSRITSIVIPEGVTKIGYYAFSNCENLTSVVLPSTLESLGKDAFCYCDNLTSIEDKSGKFIKNVDGIFYGYSTDGLQIIRVLESASGEIHIADGVTEIPSYLFNGNSHITSVIVPEGVTRIGDGAFSWCWNLTSVTLPSTLVSLGENVFSGCEKLASIADKSGKFLKVMDGIVYSTDGSRIIAVLASASGEIRIAEGVKEIPYQLFYDKDQITSIVVPEGVTQIGDEAFSWCKNLTSVTLPSTLETLGQSVFEGCENLISIVDKSGKFLKNVDGIVYTADGSRIIAVLASASGEIYIAEGVTEIPPKLFNCNSRVTSVVVPEGVTQIGEYAFSYCENLISVMLPSTLETIGESVFEGSDKLTSIEDRSGKLIKTVDGIVYSADGTRMIAVLKSASGKIHIARGVISVPDWLFYGNSRITDVIVPEGVVSIGAFAFEDCENLTSITLPSSLTVIGNDAIPTSTIIRSEPGVYAHTWALENGYTWQSTQQAESKVMWLPDGLKIIRREAFQGSPAECFVLPDGCVEIGERAFADCAKLRQVKIPASVTTIADNAFEGCGAGLVIVAPKGSMAESFAQAHGTTVTSDEP